MTNNFKEPKVKRYTIDNSYLPTVNVEVEFSNYEDVKIFNEKVVKLIKQFDQDQSVVYANKDIDLSTVEEFKGGFISGGLHNTNNLGVLKQKETILNKEDAENLLKVAKLATETLSNLDLSNINLTVNVDGLKDSEKDAQKLTATIMESLKKMDK